MPRTVISERDSTAPVPKIRTPELVGRERELAALAGVLAGTPAVVLVEGEAGIGKSRLVQEFLSGHADQLGTTLVAYCPPLRTPCTLGAVTEALRQAAPDGVRTLTLTGLAGALRPLFPEWSADLPPAPEPTGDATATRHRLFSAISELLGALDVRLLVLEDAHWADEATLEFLLFLTSRRPRRISLLATYRPEDVPASSLLLRLSSQLPAGSGRVRIQLQPLDAAGTTRLVSSMLGGEAVSAAFAAFLHQRTEGLPLALEESVRVMNERADLTRRDGEWVRRHLDQIIVPSTIRDAVLERAGRLGADAQRVLRAAAVLADPAEEPVLAAVARLTAGRARAGLCEALDSGLLAEDGIQGPKLVSFRHALSCQTVYGTIPGPDRRAMHTRAGQMLEKVFPLPLASLARHFREAGEMARWCRYGEQAADLALASGDETSAAALLHGLVTESALPAHDVARLASKLPLVLLTEPARYELADTLRRVLTAKIIEQSAAAEVRFELGRLLMAMDEYGACQTELQHAIPHLVHDSLPAVRAMTLLGLPYRPDWPRSEHLRWLRCANAAQMPMSRVDQLLLLVNRTASLLLLGEETGWDEAAMLPDDALTAGERVQISRGHLNIACGAVHWGRYAEAGRRLAVTLEMAEAHQYATLRDMALVVRTHLGWLTGTWDGLAATAASYAANDDLPPMPRLEAMLVTGLLDAATGAHSQAEKCLRRVLEEAHRRGAMNSSMEPAGALARLLLADGRIREALRITDEPCSIVARKGTWIWASELAPARVDALLRAGRLGEAADLTEAFAQGLGDLPAPAPCSALALCRAILAEGQSEQGLAAALFAQASAALDALPRPYDALLARERQASCLVAAGQREDGLTLLREVFRDLSTLGARSDAGRVMRTLAGHGVQVRRPWWGGRKGYGDQLSPRELEVVRLIIVGRSNREIAQALSRSPKTVDMQLGSAMRKLGVSTRTALAVRAIEADVIADGLDDDAGGASAIPAR